MSENLIYTLIALIASAILCSAVPPNYCSAKAKSQKGPPSCVEDVADELFSHWYRNSENRASLLKRNYRDISMDQEKQSANYQSSISNAESSDIYHHPPETCKAARGSTAKAPYLEDFQIPIPLSESKQQSGQVPSPNSITATKQYDPQNPHTAADDTHKNQQFNSANTQQIIPHYAYTGRYYYPATMLQNYRPYQIISPAVSYSDEEDDYDDETDDSSEKFFIIYRPKKASSIINKRYNSVSKISNGESVTVRELEDIIKRAITSTKQEIKEQSILHQGNLSMNSSNSPLDSKQQNKLDSKSEERMSEANKKETENGNKKDDINKKEDETHGMEELSSWEIKKSKSPTSKYLNGVTTSSTEQCTEQTSANEREERKNGEREEVEKGELNRFRKETGKNLEAEDMRQKSADDVKRTIAEDTLKKDAGETRKEDAEDKTGRNPPRQVMRIRKKSNNQKSEVDAIVPAVAKLLSDGENLGKFHEN